VPELWRACTGRSGRGAHLSFEVDSEELPPPYDEAPTVAPKAELLDEEESEDEEEEDEEEARDLDL
jgi:hypothetical protein